MIEYVVIDYDGEPTLIVDGELLNAEPPTELWDDWREEYRGGDDVYWDSDACEWALEPYEEPYAPLSKDKYDNWYEYGHY